MEPDISDTEAIDIVLKYRLTKADVDRLCYARFGYRFCSHGAIDRGACDDRGGWDTCPSFGPSAADVIASIYDDTPISPSDIVSAELTSAKLIGSSLDRNRPM